MRRSLLVVLAMAILTTMGSLFSEAKPLIHRHGHHAAIVHKAAWRAGAVHLHLHLHRQERRHLIREHQKDLQHRSR